MQVSAESEHLPKLLGGILRERREESGRSLRAVAASAGISATHLSEVERGVKEISLSRLGRMGQALGVNTGDLVLDLAIALGAAPPRRRPVGFAPDPRDQVLWALERLPDARARSLADFASFLASPTQGDR